MFEGIYKILRKDLLRSEPVEVGEWHSQSTADNPLLVTMEVPFVNFHFYVADSVEDLQEIVNPNLPWAEDHFQERVSGYPLNPPPSHRYWPWNHSQHHDADEQFSHTYPERFWPKMANVGVTRPNGRQVFVPHNGIRYEYGDLMDVVEQLRKNLYTRQAVLPVFFPEDTGNVNNVRVPCSLHYHFMFRQGLLHMRYDMRSCDFVRHFRDDVYLAARLLQWMGQQIEQPHGKLYVTIGSLHAMEGDRWKLEQERKNG